jgi:hypothetical protein
LVIKAETAPWTVPPVKPAALAIGVVCKPIVAPLGNSTTVKVALAKSPSGSAKSNVPAKTSGEADMYVALGE